MQQHSAKTLFYLNNTFNQKNLNFLSIQLHNPINYNHEIDSKTVLKTKDMSQTKNSDWKQLFVLNTPEALFRFTKTTCINEVKIY